ncbi:anthrone oxygenase family protein [Agromyces sp. H66]|uniref:anthrone oxygenase family protein n=1 Tax=Agromyces sp. H66 TaxID=2529859 RepID=UPI0010A9AFF6|nr:anthrone oxygenase family protein [Agromyces sp. H66]
MDWLIDVLLVATIVGTGVAAGVFTAFSAFVTQGLDRLPAADAARAMREINVTAVRPPFMLVLFGTALLTVAVGALALTGTLGGAAWWAIGAAAVYLVGAIGVTGAANVPRNNHLAAPPAADAPALAAAWQEFRPGWQAWNHVRALTSAAACVGFVLALVWR